METTYVVDSTVNYNVRPWIWTDLRVTKCTVRFNSALKTKVHVVYTEKQ